MPAPTFLAPRIRVAVNLESGSLGVQLGLGRLKLFRGNPVSFEFGLLFGNQVIQSTGISLVQFLVWPSGRNAGGSPLISGSTDVIDATVTDEDWVQGRKAHATINLTGAQTNITIPGDKDSEKFFFVVGGMSSLGLASWAVGDIEIIRDAFNAAVGAPPAYAPNYLTEEEVDATYIRKTHLNGNFALVGDNNLALKNEEGTRARLIWWKDIHGVPTMQFGKDFAI